VSLPRWWLQILSHLHMITEFSYIDRFMKGYIILQHALGGDGQTRIALFNKDGISGFEEVIRLGSRAGCGFFVKKK